MRISDWSSDVCSSDLAPLPKGDPSLALGTSSMTLIQLTAAYAAVAANSYPVEPHGFKEQEKGWFENLVWGPSRFGSSVHEDIEQMLRAAVNRGTGRAARLPPANRSEEAQSELQSPKRI